MQNQETKLNQLELDIAALYSYLKNPTTTPNELALVSLKMLALRIEFNVLLSLYPEYQIKDKFQASLDEATAQTLSYITIQDGQVIVSQEFKNLKK